MNKSISIIFCIHGLNGSHQDFDNLLNLFNEKVKKYGNGNNDVNEIDNNDSNNNNNNNNNNNALMVPLKANSSSPLATHDGIENGARRFYDEVIAIVNKYNSIYDRIRISFVCHSLGGLYGRYIIKLLNDNCYFDNKKSKIVPYAFISFATPHLGVRRPPTTMFNKVFQSIGSKLSTSIKQLFMADADTNGNPLLYYMAINSDYIDPLKMFRKRMLYSNIQNDFQVSFCTSNIAPYNPYKVKSRKSKKKAPLKTNPKFKHITEWSLINKSNIHWEEHEQLAFASQDIMKDKLRAMINSLNGELRWERFHCLFSTLFAHEQIIGKRSILAGEIILHHFIEENEDLFEENEMLSLL